MTPEEAIEELKYDLNTLGKGVPCDTSWGIAIEQAYAMAIKALKEVQQYQAIGTVEECREAVEKQKPNRPLGGADIAGNEYMICPHCSAIVEDGEWRADYCPDCGQAIQWDENLEVNI